MRKFTLLWLVLATMSLIAGCSTFKTEFRDEQGRALDFPGNSLGRQKVKTIVTFYQNYPGWVSVSVGSSSAYAVAFGDSVRFEMTSEKEFHYEVFWEEELGYDGVLQKVRHSKVGLYTGKPVVITEAFLRDVPKIDIVVCNNSPEATYNYDSQGNQFVLEPFGFKELKVAAGPYKLSWRPADKKYKGESLHGCKTLTVGKKVFWNGKFYEDRLFSNRSAPNWEDLEQMRRHNGCIPL